jgi:thiol-disulfide isomerase/thioredoxin
MKFGKLLGVGILAAGLLCTGCLDDVDDFDERVENSSAVVQEVTGQFPLFDTEKLDGEVVTNDIFAQKKITVVNIWGTFCGPCIGEMPELGEWARNMPEGAQLIGIVCDAYDDQSINAAIQILSEANANFVNLIPDESLAKYLQTVEAVPTTLFVDSQGNIIGDPVIGADVDSYKERVEQYLR